MYLFIYSHTDENWDFQMFYSDHGWIQRYFTKSSLSRVGPLTITIGKNGWKLNETEKPLLLHCSKHLPAALATCTQFSPLCKTTPFIPCWNPGWSSRYLFQTCLHKVSSAFEISQTSQLIWALYRYTLYLPLLQKSPVWKETKGYSEHNRQGKT